MINILQDDSEMHLPRLTTTYMLAFSSVIVMQNCQTNLVYNEHVQQKRKQIITKVQQLIADKEWWTSCIRLCRLPEINSRVVFVKL